MGKHPERQKQKGKPQKPSLKIPSSPSTASQSTSAVPPDNNLTPEDSHSDQPSPFETPPTSPPNVATEIPSMDTAEPEQFDSSLSEPQENKKGGEMQNGMKDPVQMASPGQTQPAQGELQQTPTDPMQNQEEAPTSSETPKDQQSSEEKQEDDKTLAQNPENTQLPAEGESSLPPVQGEGDPRSVGGFEDQKQSEPQGEEQPPSEPAPEEKALQLPADGQEGSESLAQDRDDSQPPPEHEGQAQTPTQNQESNEKTQKELPLLPEEVEVEVEPPVQDQEQCLDPESQSKTAENDQKPSQSDRGPEQDAGPSTQTQETLIDPLDKPLTPISASDVASKDIMAIANALFTMKTTLISMANAFDRLGQQSETMVSLTLDLKAEEQIRQVQSTLERQIARQKAEIESLRSTLRDKIKQTVEEKIRNELMDVIRIPLKQEIEERVRNQLSIQIPENLRQQVISHKRQILEVRTSLHNSEARRHNSLQTVPGPHARLRPLLRPLPTPEQSPVIIISRSSSMEPSTFPTPATAFPQAPAPTPIKRVSSNSLRSALVPETTPRTPSRLFPRDLTALFALSQEEARTLLREYGLDSATSSPTKESARPRGLSVVTEESSDTVHDEDPDAHARDLNKFMAHIGVPFLMIPAPKEKIDLSAPLSSRSRRKLLTPLIIK